MRRDAVLPEFAYSKDHTSESAPRTKLARRLLFYTWRPLLLPATVLTEGQPGEVWYCMVSAGMVDAGGTVPQSVLVPEVPIAPGALVEGCVLLDGVRVGRGAVARNAILDKNVVVADGAQVGVDLEADRALDRPSPCVCPGAHRPAGWRLRCLRAADRHSRGELLSATHSGW